jgi:hypothetical protein
MRLQDKFDNDIINWFYKHFEYEIIPKFEPISNWIVESYYTYFSINNYSVKLTCMQNNEYNYIIVENIVVYSK